jgi:hypothetical protein
MKTIGIGIVMLAASFTTLAQDASWTLVDPTYACVEKMTRDGRLSVIADKVALAHGASLKTVRGLDRAANAEERAAVALWLDRREQCFAAGGYYRFTALTPQEHLAVYQSFEFQQRLLVNLEQGRMSYAQFNRRRLELAEGLYWGI